jgi:hypothetical protein
VISRGKTNAWPADAGGGRCRANVLRGVSAVLDICVVARKTMPSVIATPLQAAPFAATLRAASSKNAQFPAAWRQ